MLETQHVLENQQLRTQMGKRKTPLELAKRERQIVDTVVKLEEASVADVLQHLADPPSYSAVRAIMTVLVEKKWLKYRRDGKRFLYSPVGGVDRARRNAMTRLLDTFFGGSPSDALAALLDSKATQLSDEEIERMSNIVNQAKKERKQ